MNTAQRRTEILKLLQQEEKPVAARAMASQFGVSRQVIVQDMAVIRASTPGILSTTRGYVLQQDKDIACTREFKVRHGQEQAAEELNLIVDMGGTVLDVMVNHKIYGKISAPLDIKSRRDVQKFMERLKAGKSTPLLNITSGYHFHRVYGEKEEILDEIEEMLREKGFLCEIFPYEQELEEM